MLEPPCRGGSIVYPQSMFWSKNKKNIKLFLMKFSIFTGEKNLCILHGRVFVMFHNCKSEKSGEWTGIAPENIMEIYEQQRALKPWLRKSASGGKSIRYYA